MKKLLYSITILLFSCSTILFSQEFAPKKGNLQFSLILGNGFYFPGENSLSKLLPANNATQIGIGQAGQNESENPGVYLNIGGLNNNSIVNMAGVEAKYFISNRIDINMSFAMDINLTPKRDYFEGDTTVTDMIIPGYKYINAEMTNKWYATIGSNYYFKTKNSRIFPYLGVQAGYLMGWIGVNRPYTGVENAEGDPVEIYSGSNRSGQMIGISGSFVSGIEYNLAEGVNIALEVNPFSYQFGSIQLKPAGMDSYVANSQQFRLFMNPHLKLGFRF
jgi:hypothetical protein